MIVLFIYAYTYKYMFNFIYVYKFYYLSDKTKFLNFLGEFHENRLNETGFSKIE